MPGTFIPFVLQQHRTIMGILGHLWRLMLMDPLLPEGPPMRHLVDSLLCFVLTQSLSRGTYTEIP
eukprot:gene9796-7011_t